VGDFNGRTLLWATVASVGLYLVAAVFPIFGVLISAIVPLPVLYIRASYGRKAALAALAAAVLAISLIAAFWAGTVSIMFFLQLTVTGFIMGEIWSRALPMDRTMTLSVAASVGVSVVLLLFASVSDNVGPVELLRNDLRQNLEVTFELYRSLGMSVGSEQDFSELAQKMAGRILEVLPAIVIMGSSFLVWINLLLCNRMITRFKGPQRWENLTTWQAPERLVWAVVVFGFGSLTPVSAVKIIAVNCLFLVALVYFFQGISITAWFFKSKGVPNFVRGMLYVLIVIQQLLTLLVAALGLFDTWFDFRKLHKSKEESAP